MTMADRAALIEPYIPALRRYAWALCRSQSEADDLVQDCLERALGAWHLRRTDSSPRAWLFAILHNRFVSTRRQRSRSDQHVMFDDTTSSLPARQEDGLAMRDLATALAQLPEEQRVVLLLVGVEDLSYAEVAQALGVPVGTVMSRLSRGRSQLQRLLEGGSSTRDRPLVLRRVR